jgi:ABC-2 type transport system permease protein
VKPQPLNPNYAPGLLQGVKHLSWAKLIVPWWLSQRRRLETGERLRLLLFLALGSFFWAGTFWGFWKVLDYFRSIESLGDILAAKLLSMILLTFLALLVFSNVVTSFSSFFLSRDLELLLSAPIGTAHIYKAKLLETLTGSSWMVMLFGTPVFLVYGVVYGASWSYYMMLALSLPPFLMIPAAVGVALMMGLANLFPARRARDVMLLMGLVFGVGLYLLIRFLQPERLVDPETFSGVLGYLVALNAPRYPLLPSHWIVQAICPSLFGTQGAPLFFLSMLWSTACAFVVLGGWFAQMVYRAGWSRSQEGRRAPMSRSRLVRFLVARWAAVFPTRLRPMVAKDAITFLRDPSQWSQLLLLGALIVVYLYNFAALPLEKAPVESWYLQNLIAFLNMGLAGFVVAAVAVRFVFPAVSLEGRAFWIIRSSPLSLKTFVWAKFWTSLLPLALLSELLVVASNALLKVAPFMMLLSTITMLLASFALTGLGVGLGALYPRFQVENVAHISNGMGGLVYMLLAVGFMGGVVILEGVPVYLVFHSRFTGVDLGLWSYLSMGVSLALLGVLMAAAWWIPMSKGLSSLEKWEE